MTRIGPFRILPPAALLGAVFWIMAAGAFLVGAVAILKTSSILALLLTLAWLALALVATKAGSLPGSQWTFTGLIVAVSLVARLASLDLLDGREFTADPMNYTNLARAIMSGEGMIADDWQYGKGLRAYFPPLFPIVLAGWWTVFGESSLATLWLNFLTCLGIGWCLFDLGRRLDNEPAGRAAALLFLIYPAWLVNAGVPNKELVTILLALLFFRTILLWQLPGADRKSWRHAIWLGSLWGLMALTQAALALAPPVIGLLLMPRYGWRNVLVLGIRALPFFILVMAPWWVRNWLLFGQFVPFTTAAGFMVNVMLGEAKLPITPEIMALSEPARSTVMAKLAFAQMLEHPQVFLKTVASSLVKVFAYEEATLSQYRQMIPPIDAASRTALTPPVQFAWAALLGGAALASVREWRAKADNSLIPLALAVLASISAINMWFEFGERHRYILTPLLILLAAQALTRAEKR